MVKYYFMEFGQSMERIIIVDRNGHVSNTVMHALKIAERRLKE